MMFRLPGMDVLRTVLNKKQDKKGGRVGFIENTARDEAERGKPIGALESEIISHCDIGVKWCVQVVIDRRSDQLGKVFVCLHACMIRHRGRATRELPVALIMTRMAAALARKEARETMGFTRARLAGCLLRTGKSRKRGPKA